MLRGDMLRGDIDMLRRDRSTGDMLRGDMLRGDIDVER